MITDRCRLFKGSLFTAATEESQGSNHASEAGSVAPADNHSTVESLAKAPTGAKPSPISYPEAAPPPAFAYPAPGVSSHAPPDALPSLEWFSLSACPQTAAPGMFSL